MACIAAFEGIRNSGKLKSLRILILVPLTEIAFCIALLFGPLFLNTRKIKSHHLKFDYADLTFYCGEVFNFFEFTVIMIFLFESLSYLPYKRLVQALTFIGLAILSFSFLSKSREELATNSYAIASFLIIVSLILYFKRRVAEIHHTDFQKDPIFIVASGCFIQFCMTFPSSILLHILNPSDLRISEVILLVDYTAYTFYFYFIYKGFQCQIKLTK